jgi:hypothetical protein
MLRSLIVVVLVVLTSSADAQFAQNVFDKSSGANTYYTNGIGEHLDDSNWQSTFAGLSPNAGSEFLASGNGNQNHNFVDIGLSKDLGGVVQNHPYTVSFFIARYLDLQPIQVSDFSVLSIGGPTGTMNWTNTPAPIVNDQWYKWTGTYTPSISDVGGAFTFNAVFTLRSMSAIAIDGLIKVPEPATSFLAVTAAVGGLFVWRFART